MPKRSTDAFTLTALALLALIEITLGVGAIPADAEAVLPGLMVTLQLAPDASVLAHVVAIVLPVGNVGNVAKVTLCAAMLPVFVRVITRETPLTAKAIVETLLISVVEPQVTPTLLTFAPLIEPAALFTAQDKPLG